MSSYPDIAVEAARHAVLRRLVPAIRHAVAGQLHHIVLAAEIMQLRVDAATPEITVLKESAYRVRDMARKTARTSADWLGWLFPEENETVPLAAGLADCLRLLNMGFSMRGFSIDNKVSDLDVRVSQSALRTVVPAALLATLESPDMASDIALDATASTSEVCLSIKLMPAKGGFNMGSNGDSTPLSWHEVEILAASEGVTLTRQNDGVDMNYEIKG